MGITFERTETGAQAASRPAGAGQGLAAGAVGAKRQEGMRAPTLGLSVILLDNTEVSAKMVEAKLAAAGHQVTSSWGMVDALERSNAVDFTSKYDAVLVCSTLYSNQAVAARLGGLNRRMPVLVMAHDRSPSTLMTLVMSGCTEILCKPPPPEDLRTLWKYVMRFDMKHGREMGRWQIYMEAGGAGQGEAGPEGAKARAECIGGPLAAGGRDAALAPTTPVTEMGCKRAREGA